MTSEQIVEQASNEVIAEERNNEEELDQLLKHMESSGQLENPMTAAGMFNIKN